MQEVKISENGSRSEIRTCRNEEKGEKTNYIFFLELNF